MKWSTILSTSALTAAVLASPIAKREEAVEVFHLRISSDFKDLDGQLISASDDNLGVYSNGADSAIRVTKSHPDGSDNISLHTYPVGVVDHALGLSGDKDSGYLDFKDYASPATAPEEKISYEEFIVGDNNELLFGVKLATPGWIASPQGDDWSIKYFDNKGGSFVAQDYIPITIELVAVEV